MRILGSLRSPVSCWPVLYFRPTARFLVTFCAEDLEQALVEHITCYMGSAGPHHSYNPRLAALRFASLRLTNAHAFGSLGSRASLFATARHPNFTLAFSKGANGGCGGKAAKLPAPPTATQRL